MLGALGYEAEHGTERKILVGWGGGLDRRGQREEAAGGGPGSCPLGLAVQMAGNLVPAPAAEARANYKFI